MAFSRSLKERKHFISRCSPAAREDGPCWPDQSKSWSVVCDPYSCNRLSRLMLLKLGRSYRTDSYPMSVVYLFCLFVNYSGELIVLPLPMLIYLGIWELLSVRISKYWQLAKQNSNVYFPCYVLAYSHKHLYSHFVQTHFLSLRTSYCFNSHFLKKWSPPTWQLWVPAVHVCHQIPVVFLWTHSCHVTKITKSAWMLMIQTLN